MLTKKKVKKVEEGQLDYYKTFTMFLLSSAKCHFYFGFSEKCLLFLTNTCHLRDVCKKGNNKLKKNSKKKHQMIQNGVKLIYLWDSRLY